MTSGGSNELDVDKRSHLADGKPNSSIELRAFILLYLMHYYISGQNLLECAVMDLLSLKNVSLAYGLAPLLQDANFTIDSKTAYLCYWS